MILNNYFILAFALVLWRKLGAGLAFQIEINPNTTDEFVPSDVQISCRMDDSDCRVKEVILMEMLNPEGKPIAAVRQNSKMSSGVAMGGYHKADGRVSETVSENYLKVNISNPRREESGVYTCVVYYLDGLSLLKEMRRNSSLLVDAETSMMLNYMRRKMSLLETELKEQRNESVGQMTMLKKQVTVLESKLREKETESTKLRQLLEKRLADERNASIINEIKHEQMITGCFEEISVLKRQVALLEGKVSDQEKGNMAYLSRLEVQMEEHNKNHLQEGDRLKGQIASIKWMLERQEDTYINHTGELLHNIQEQKKVLELQSEKESQKEAFSVGYTRAIIMKVGDTMIFDDIIMSEGQGYNAASGTFTAPRAGFYLFHLSVTERSENWVDLALKVNTRVIGRLMVGDRAWDNQSSVSCVTKLEAGDKVKTAVYSRGSRFDANSILVNRYSIFSGYLLKPF